MCIWNSYLLIFLYSLWQAYSSVISLMAFPIEQDLKIWFDVTIPNSFIFPTLYSHLLLCSSSILNSTPLY